MRSRRRNYCKFRRTKNTSQARDFQVTDSVPRHVTSFPSPFPVIPFLALPNFLDELALKRLLRRRLVTPYQIRHRHSLT